MNQPTLFEAREARDKGMKQVEENASSEWKEMAWEWLVNYLEVNEEFFPDDVWAAGLPVPKELRAFGPLVLRAARAGYIVKSGKLRQRTRGHGTAAAVWASTIYRS